MSGDVADAVVIGAGPNGLVGANALADAGWSVLLLEAATETGGAVRTAEVTAPGFHTDRFSAFYPLAAASPVIRGLDLGDHGLAWEHAPDVLAHVLDDGRAAVLSTSLERTAASVDEFAAGDGAAWVELAKAWQAIRDPLLDALFTPFPPVRAVVRLLRRTGVAGSLDLARLAVLPVRRLAEERFRGEGAALLLAGNAMHSDVPPNAAGSGVFGWLLAMLGQDRPETPVDGLFLAGASAHPGGGVHGACGWNAALSALRAAGRTGPARRRLNQAVWGRLLPPGCAGPAGGPRRGSRAGATPRRCGVSVRSAAPAGAAAGRARRTRPPAG